MAKRSVKGLKGFPGSSSATEGMMMAGGGRGGGGRKLKWGKIISNLFKGKGKGAKLKGEKIKEVQTKPKKSLEGQKLAKIKRRKKEEIGIQERGQIRKKQETMKSEGRKNRRQKKKSLYEPWLND